MTITYRFANNLYLNITNRCSCDCTFCIRLDSDGVGDGDNLWLEREPTVEEIIAALKEQDLTQYGSVVFCGYGEPTERLDVVLKVCRYLKSLPKAPPIRLNTNGLSDLINGRETAPLLEGLVDTVSVSLNAPNAKRYLEIVNPVFGEGSFEAMLQFAQACKRYVPSVIFSVVDVLSAEETEACETLAALVDIPMRLRVKS